MSFSPSFNAGNSQFGAAPLRPRRSRGLREVTARSERRRSGGTGPRAAPPTPGTARLGSAPPRSERAAPQGAAPTPRGAHRPPHATHPPRLPRPGPLLRAHLPPRSCGPPDRARSAPQRSAPPYRAHIPAPSRLPSQPPPRPPVTAPVASPPAASEPSTSSARTAHGTSAPAAISARTPRRPAPPTISAAPGHEGGKDGPAGPRPHRRTRLPIAPPLRSSVPPPQLDPTNHREGLGERLSASRPLRGEPVRAGPAEAPPTSRRAANGEARRPRPEGVGQCAAPRGRTRRAPVPPPAGAAKGQSGGGGKRSAVGGSPSGENGVTAAPLCSPADPNLPCPACSTARGGRDPSRVPNVAGMGRGCA